MGVEICFMSVFEVAALTIRLCSLCLLGKVYYGVMQRQVDL